MKNLEVLVEYLAEGDLLRRAEKSSIEVYVGTSKGMYVYSRQAECYVTRAGGLLKVGMGTAGDHLNLGILCTIGGKIALL